jgi:hypothetical protein
MDYDVPMRLEAQATVQLLRGCQVCGHKHPKAYSPPLAMDCCPVCGTPSVVPDDPVDATAIIARDWRMRFGAFLMRIGTLLHNLTEGKP